MCVLSLAVSVQAAPIPVSVDSSVESVIGADALALPAKSLKTLNLQVKDFTQGRRVTLVSFDISGLTKDHELFANMKLSVLGGNSSGKVDVYGVIEDQDNISSGLTWRNAPGVNNDQPIGYPVDLDEADLTDKLLSFTSPKRDERGSAGSAALDDFINSDTDGVVTLLLAPAKKGTDALMKSSGYPGGGAILEGDITTGIDIILVTQERDFDVDGVQDDQGLIDVLNAQGHNVDVRMNYWDDLDGEPEKVDELSAADLVIVSRATGSGDFDDGNEPTLWNSVTAPLIQMSAYLPRSSRWLWVNSTSTMDFQAPAMQVVPNGSPLFDGLPLDADGMMDIIDPSVGTRDPNDANDIGDTTFLGIVPEEIGNGIVLANTVDGIVWIAVWNAGVETYEGSGQIPAGKRMMFPMGTHERKDMEPFTPWGAMNLNENGQALLLNMCLYMAKLPAPPLAAHWPMDEGSGTVVADVVGGNDGTMVGLDPNVAWIADGAIDGAISFDNIDGNHIEVPHSDALDFADEDFTISMWVRYDAHPGDTDRWIIKGTHGGDGTGSRYEIFQTSGDQLRFAIDNGPDNIKSSLRPEGTNAAIITGDWVHVVAVRDAEIDLMSLYADGVLLGTLDEGSGDISSGEDMWIGESTDETGTAMAGDMDDLRIINAALSQDILHSIY
jgi:hypothetical protein